MGIITESMGIRVGRQWLFRGLDCAVGQGECLALVGPNGAGKSSLLRVLYGMQAPAEGRVEVAGRIPDERSVEFRRQVSVLLDDSDVFAELTPVQHIELLAGSFGTEVDSARLLAEAGLDERSGVAAGSLSAGQRRRLMLLGATARPFEVLLLDEPERALDADGRDWLAGLVRRAKENGAAIVVATHHQPLLDTAESVITLPGAE
ncbi:ABC transporter ATP-binding protein [Amycolatopsis sp. YIM 10]|uniref:ABC transporter ATP-binding protein n=1 Tax=Amycolatopsis sp. YIM 10 TaxID=2653857 RepID=UPI00129082D8|nr:ABC transporter ATP-binding protein [Amycolatopsis sp. YIM 10]QFU94604.1 SkfA peptide export ATP-binding protein SkfE [Amycolatopsis sp. YIM 10]